MADAPKRPAGNFQEITDEDLNGITIPEISCRGCSGYGNCGFKAYRLYNGKAVAICTERRKEVEAERAAAAAS